MEPGNADVLVGLSFARSWSCALRLLTKTNRRAHRPERMPNTGSSQRWRVMPPAYEVCGWCWGRDAWGQPAAQPAS